VTTFLVFLLAYVLSQFFRSFLAVIAPELSAELGLGPAEPGAVLATWFLTFALAQFGIGVALDRLGPRRTVAALMVAAVAGAALFATARSYLHCLVAMGLIGIGCAPVYMGALYVFARAAAPERFALLSSWLIGLGSAGNLLGATPLALAAATIGWRSAFLLIALLTALSALLVLWLVRDPPAVAGAPARKGAGAELLDILSLRALWPIFPVALLSYAAVAAERGLWVGPYLDEVHGLDPVARGNVVLLMAAAMSAGALVYGPLDRLFGTRKWVAATGVLVTGAAFLALSRVGAGAGAAALLLAVIGAFGMSYAVIMAHARIFFPEHLIGRGMTFVNFLFIGGAGLIQPASGALVARMEAAGFPQAAVYGRLHLAFGLLLIGSGAIYLFSRERRSSARFRWTTSS
jgi:predicted MFS family arabinose efflux permease